MNQKIMAIIYSERGNFLLLRTNPKWMNVDVWFIVTGSIEKGEVAEEAVKREIKEETNLTVLDIKSTNYSCKYENPPGKWNNEKAFLVKVKESVPRLSGEHTEYMWVTKKDFIEKIGWDEKIDSKDKLKEILSLM